MQHETQKRAAAAERGFTLIELLVVILIIGILAAIAIPSFLNQKTKASDASAKELAHTMQVAAETYGTDNDGNYSNLSVAILNQYESTINTNQNNGDAFAFAASGAQNQYAVTAESTTGDQFTITRGANGNTTRTCTPTSGINGGCVNGTW